MRETGGDTDRYREKREDRYIQIKRERVRASVSETEIQRKKGKIDRYRPICVRERKKRGR